MQSNASISIDLPLKIAVWEDPKGSVWVAFPQMGKMSDKYDNIDRNIIGKMQTLLENIAIKSANIYQ